MAETIRNNTGGYTATALLDHIAGSTVYPAICWLLRSKQGVTVGATTHTRDLALAAHPGVIFREQSGIVPTLIDSETGSGSTGLQVFSVFSDEITEEQIDAGDWNSAEFEIFAINRKVPEMGELVFFSGEIGQVDAEGVTYTAEARPLSSKTGRQLGRVVGHKCEVREFADKNTANRCKLDPATFTSSGTVTTGASTTIFRASGLSALADGHTYTNGVVTWVTGVNAGRKSEIKRWDNTTKEVELHIEMPELIAVGATFTVLEGCDRTAGICHNTFANIINFRGYPQQTNPEDMSIIDPAQ